MIAPEIKEKDIPILETLNNIQYIPDSENGLKYRIIFTFAENEYFTNTELTKYIEMKDDDEP